MSPVVKISLFKMFALGLLLAFPSMMGGFILGYPTLALPQMKLSVDEASWFSSAPGFSALVGGVVIGILTDTIGRRNATLAGLSTHILGWGLMAWNYNFAVLLTGRILSGITFGTLYYPGQVYTVECITVHHKRWRSSITTWFGITTCGGTFLITLLSYFFHYRIICVIIVAITLTLFTTIWVVLPESPTWLYLQGRVKEAEKSLNRLNLDSSIFNNLKPNLPTVPQTTGTFQNYFGWMKMLQRKDVYKPTWILSAIIIILTFSGVPAILNYQVQIIGPDPYTEGSNSEQQFSLAYKSGVISGVVVLLARIFSAVLLPVLGARKTMVSSCACLVAALVLLGYVSQDRESASFFYWRCIVIWVIAFVYYLGVGLTPYSMMGDSFPADAKGFASIPLLISDVALGVILKIHPFLLRDVGPDIFYIHAGIAFISIFYAIYFLHETVGKTLEEINESFKR